MANRRSDNTFRDASVLKLDKTLRNSLGEGDRVDVLKFRAADAVDFTLSLKGLKANVNVRLFDESRSLVATSSPLGKATEQLITTLEQGLHYIQVRLQGRGDTRYTLRTSATPTPVPLPLPSPSPTPIPPPIPPAPSPSPSPIPVPSPSPAPIPSGNDDAIATAFDIGVLSTTYIKQESIGTNDLVDFYKFTLNDIANLDVRINDSARVRSVQLIRDDNNNGLVDDGEVFAPRAFSSLTPLDMPPGTYFIRVEGFSNVLSPYELTLVPSLFGGNVSPDPGNTLPVASDLGIFSGTRSVREYVGTLDLTDVYRFTLNDLTNLQITATVPTTPVKVQLVRDANNNGLLDTGEVFASREGSGLTTPAKLNEDLPVGTYFITVEPRFGANFATAYEMTLVGTPYGGNGLPDPGNTIPAARNLGVLPGTTSLKEYVGELDSFDFYKFTLNSAANLQASLTTSMDKDIDVLLIQDTNNNGLIDSNETIRSGIDGLTQNLQAGTYFLSLKSRFSGFSTNYGLNLVIS